jgi:hypothetical protein
VSRVVLMAMAGGRKKAETHCKVEVNTFSACPPHMGRIGYGRLQCSLVEKADFN